MPDESFVSLGDGFTHYQWQGPENGPKVVLIHGFSSPYFVWDKTISALAEEGFRVLRYDLYGRGLSDRPQTQYTGDLFDRQLTQLLDSQGVTGPVDLVGLSMGGAIVMNFTDRHPERVARIVLFAPAGLNKLPVVSNLLLLPGFGEWFMRAYGDIFITYAVPNQITETPSILPLFKDAYRKQLQYKGYKRAILSTFRHGPLTSIEEVYARVGQQNRRGLLLWGANDTVVPVKLHERVLQLIPWLNFHMIPGSGHCSCYQSPEEINPILVHFLKTNAKE